METMFLPPRVLNLRASRIEVIEHEQASRPFFEGRRYAGGLEVARAGHFDMLALLARLAA